MRKEKAKAYYTVDIDKTNSVDTVLATYDMVQRLKANRDKECLSILAL